MNFLPRLVRSTVKNLGLLTPLLLGARNGASFILQPVWRYLVEPVWAASTVRRAKSLARRFSEELEENVNVVEAQMTMPWRVILRISALDLELTWDKGMFYNRIKLAKSASPWRNLTAVLSFLLGTPVKNAENIGEVVALMKAHRLQILQALEQGAFETVTEVDMSKFEGLRGRK